MSVFVLAGPEVVKKEVEANPVKSRQSRPQTMKKMKREAQTNLAATVHPLDCPT